jgi:3-methylcrotonyl-CoA carboxylase alpha subunit
MLSPMLIANRGEIACRIAATARRLGVRTIAVYSDADAGSAHVAACDEALRIGTAEPRDSYLRGGAIIAAALAAGARAIHPGYGFLSENVAFASAVAAAGLVLIGPPPAAIAAMGSKSAAKTLMAEAGVPLVPGYHGDNQDAAFLQGQADAIGYPVLIKASAGGGGKGMRVVEAAPQFGAALEACRREAASSFGDDRVLLERYLQKPRHIEIQVFADQHGNCLSLFERDCSIQRRHQKVIEEAPAPGMTPERRLAMGEAAVAAARAVAYEGAGTVEFIVEPGGRFYFMEMNTRLQVEHPITEMITGLDLVEWQLRVAAGEALPLTQAELRIEGHAIEARIYAENPDKGFLPSIGTLRHLRLPPHAAFARADVRVDGGVREGDTITPYYDPMIAKLIVHGADREQARLRMLQALAATRVAGVQTNVAFLSRLMADEAFAQADLDTGLIERRHATLLPPPRPASALVLALACAAVMAADGLPQAGSAADAACPPAPPSADPWAAADGWRVGGGYRRGFEWHDGERLRQPMLRRQGRQWTFMLDGAETAIGWQRLPDSDEAAQRPHTAQDARVRVALGETSVLATVVRDGAQVLVFGPDGLHTLTLADTLAHADEEAEHGGNLAAPMPGKILSIAVVAGAAVKRGQALIVMEAMKMEHTITAPQDGTVAEVFYAVGDQVAEGAELMGMQAISPPTPAA